MNQVIFNQSHTEGAATHTELELVESWGAPVLRWIFKPIPVRRVDVLPLYSAPEIKQE